MKGPSRPVGKANLISDVLDEIRQELQRSWTHQRKYIDFPRQTSVEWELYPLLLGPEPWKLELSNVKRLCNRPTCFYWKESAQDRGFYCNRLVLVGAYKEWFECHNDEPDIEYDRFFANPVRITPGGPTTVAQILEAHRSLCELSTSLLRDVKSEGFRIPFGTVWMYPEKYYIPDLFRAIIVVHDEHITYDKFKYNESGKLLVDDFLEKQSVLLIRTGDQSGLSAPISFDGLEAISPFCLENSPVEDLSCFDTIRVSLRTAVRFIVSLEKREKDATSASELAAKTQELPTDNEDDESKGPGTALDYANDVIRTAERVGYENDPTILDVLRKLEAYKRGESFEDHHEEAYRFNRRWEW